MKNRTKAGTTTAKNKRKSMLAILAQERTKNAIDTILVGRRDYQAAWKEFDRAHEQLKKTGLTASQQEAVDNLVSASNSCAAIHSRVAYRLGMQDGIKLASELHKIADGKA